MKRRQFLTTTAAILAAATTPFAHAQPAPTASSSRQWIEIRTYHFASPEKQAAYAQFLTTAGIPALNRATIPTVGLFHELAADNPKLKLDKDSTDLWLILAHDTPDSFATLEPRLAADADYQSQGKEILLASKDDPAFTRYDTELLIAFEGFPRLKPRDLKDGRVLELRTYQSRTQERAASKMKMFNSAEISIFERIPIPGIFWGEAIAGTDLPHLTYMVWHASIEQAPKNWKLFGADPQWNQLKNEEQYKDNVSNIVNRFLRPLPGSQI